MKNRTIFLKLSCLLISFSAQSMDINKIHSKSMKNITKFASKKLYHTFDNLGVKESLSSNDFLKELTSDKFCKQIFRKIIKDMMVKKDTHNLCYYKANLNFDFATCMESFLSKTDLPFVRQEEKRNPSEINPEKEEIFSDKLLKFKQGSYLAYNLLSIIRNSHVRNSPQFTPKSSFEDLSAVHFTAILSFNPSNQRFVPPQKGRLDIQEENTSMKVAAIQKYLNYFRITHYLNALNSGEYLSKNELQNILEFPDSYKAKEGAHKEIACSDGRKVLFKSKILNEINLDAYWNWFTIRKENLTKFLISDAWQKKADIKNIQSIPSETKVQLFSKKVEEKLGDIFFATRKAFGLLSLPEVCNNLFGVTSETRDQILSTDMCSPLKIEKVYETIIKEFHPEVSLKNIYALTVSDLTDNGILFVTLTDFFICIDSMEKKMPIVDVYHTIDKDQAFIKEIILACTGGKDLFREDLVEWIRTYISDPLAQYFLLVNLPQDHPQIIEFWKNDPFQLRGHFSLWLRQGFLGHNGDELFIRFCDVFGIDLQLIEEINEELKKNKEEKDSKVLNEFKQIESRMKR